MRLYLILLVALVGLSSINSYRGPFRKLLRDQHVTPLRPGDDPGEPLFLTPYLEQGKVDEARRLR